MKVMVCAERGSVMPSRSIGCLKLCFQHKLKHSNVDRVPYFQYEHALFLINNIRYVLVDLTTANIPTCNVNFEKTRLCT